jgi:hypothetical protein
MAFRLMGERQQSSIQYPLTAMGKFSPIQILATSVIQLARVTPSCVEANVDVTSWLSWPRLYSAACLGCC